MSNPDLQGMTVSEEEIVFFAEVGWALRQWAAVEGQLRSLVAMSLRPTDGLAVSAAFMSIENFRSKLKFCDSLIRCVYRDSPHILAWSNLFKLLEKRSAVRNSIAHGRHVLHAEGAAGRRWAIVEWSEPEPIKTMPGKSPTLASGAICLANVVTARMHFRRLTGELASFQSQLRGRPALPPEFLGPEADAPDLQSSRSQIRRALGMPLRPSRRKSQSEQET